MAEAGSGPRWRFLISPRWLAWHAFAVVAFWGMCWLGDWQFHRAISGNSLSWAYTFEWPLFAVLGGYFWAKTIRDEFHLPSGAVSGTAESPCPGEPCSGKPRPGRSWPEKTWLGKTCRRRLRATVAGPMAGHGPGGAAGPGDREADARAAYLARLSQEVRGHGRWHGLR